MTEVQNLERTKDQELLGGIDGGNSAPRSSLEILYVESAIRPKRSRSITLSRSLRAAATNTQTSKGYVWLVIRTRPLENNPPTSRGSRRPRRSRRTSCAIDATSPETKEPPTSGGSLLRNGARSVELVQDLPDLLPVSIESFLLLPGRLGGLGASVVQTSPELLLGHAIWPAVV